MVHVLHAHVEGARNPYVGRDVGIPRSSSSLASSMQQAAAGGHFFTAVQYCTAVQCTGSSTAVLQLYCSTAVQYSCSTAVLQL